MATRVVVGPVVVLPQKETGLLGYYYQGATLPDGLDEERVQSAITDGLVREDVDPKQLTADDLSVAAAGDTLRANGRPDESAAAAADSGDGPPPKAANKEAWVDYAVAQELAATGPDADEAQLRADAESMTKDQLIDKYGS